jgi:hypothetical protein
VDINVNQSIGEKEMKKSQQNWIGKKKEEKILFYLLRVIESERDGGKI